MAKAKRSADPVNPEHYVLWSRDDMAALQERMQRQGSIQVIDVIEVAGLTDKHYVATAVAYLLRAGKKPGSSFEEEVQKAMWYLRREMDMRAREMRKPIVIGRPRKAPAKTKKEPAHKSPVAARLAAKVSPPPVPGTTIKLGIKKEIGAAKVSPPDWKDPENVAPKA